jgi:DNA-binding transcriptional MerR regulator
VDADQHLTIAETSERTGLSPHTLRYYERVGLLDPVERGTDGRRRYRAADLAWLGFLLRLRITRMPIRAMQRFAELRRRGDQSVPERLALLRAHRERAGRDLDELAAAVGALDDKIRHYEALADGATGRKEHRSA